MFTKSLRKKVNATIKLWLGDEPHPSEPQSQALSVAIGQIDHNLQSISPLHYNDRVCKFVIDWRGLVITPDQ